MASQQFFGGLLAAAAVVIGYLAYKGRLQAIWAAAIGAGEQQPASAGTTAGLPVVQQPGLYKYAVSIGKSGVILGQNGPGDAPTQPTSVGG